MDPNSVRPVIIYSIKVVVYSVRAAVSFVKWDDIPSCASHCSGLGEDSVIERGDVADTHTGPVWYLLSTGQWGLPAPMRSKPHSMQTPFHPGSLFFGQGGGWDTGVLLLEGDFQALVVFSLSLGRWSVDANRMPSHMKRAYGAGLAGKPPSQAPGLQMSFLVLGCHNSGSCSLYACFMLAFLTLTEPPFFPS